MAKEEVWEQRSLPPLARPESTSLFFVAVPVELVRRALSAAPVDLGRRQCPSPLAWCMWCLLVHPMVMLLVHPMVMLLALVHVKPAGFHSLLLALVHVVPAGFHGSLLSMSILSDTMWS